MRPRTTAYGSRPDQFLELTPPAFAGSVPVVRDWPCRRAACGLAGSTLYP
ncbi:hypothetical protein SAMN04488085_106185 [Geodermatophilus ruber]|uniref:Uncharacterized protein n=1 Tax=Geodermatophilus ruber TaxID=504800 RepID=A0A1I4EX05_9ACTN|nr:hypothetical protein SAMN04488085_106185 [Geodermatophilus ruber]